MYPPERQLLHIILNTYPYFFFWMPCIAIARVCSSIFDNAWVTYAPNAATGSSLVTGVGCPFSSFKDEARLFRIVISSSSLFCFAVYLLVVVADSNGLLVDFDLSGAGTSSDMSDSFSSSEWVCASMSDSLVSNFWKRNVLYLGSKDTWWVERYK